MAEVQSSIKPPSAVISMQCRCLKLEFTVKQSEKRHVEILYRAVRYKTTERKGNFPLALVFANKLVKSIVF